MRGLESLHTKAIKYVPIRHLSYEAKDTPILFPEGTNVVFDEPSILDLLFESFFGDLR